LVRLFVLYSIIHLLLYSFKLDNWLPFLVKANSNDGDLDSHEIVIVMMFAPNTIMLMALFAVCFFFRFANGAGLMLEKC
jgi:hypothetical protein